MTAASQTCAGPFIASLMHKGLLGIAATLALAALTGAATSGGVRLARLTPTQFRILLLRYYATRFYGVIILFLLAGMALVQALSGQINAVCNFLY